MPKHCPKCDRAIPERARGGICPYCALYDAVRGHEAPTLEFADHTKRGFIFCLFAVQLGHATAEQFIQVGVDWVSNPETDFLGEFQKVADIDPEKLALLNQLTDVAIEHHGDDVEKTLQGMGLEHGLDDLAELSLAPYAKADPTLPEPPMALNIDFADPRVIQEDRDRYTRKSEYSRGGMGRILLVHDQFLARDIALKELLPHGLQGTTATPGKETPLKRTAGMVARFLREAKITGQLEHPNIVPVYELGRREEGSFYYTMKLIRGESMSAALKNTKNMDERMALLPHFVDLCQAVAYAHSRQVVHRDLKPSNIMLGPFGETVVIDWGLAKVVGQTDDVADEISSVLDSFRLENADDDEFRTRTGARLGTPAYMSPEQARGEISTIGPQSDVFSLGSMLYELLTGSPPFDDKPVSLLLQRIAHDQVPAVGTVGRDLPPELSAICDRALRHDVDDRYEDAGALLEDLRSFVSGAVVSAHRYSIVQMVKRVYRRNRDAINVALVGAAALVLLSIYSYVQIYNERDEAVQARDEAQELGYINGIKLVDTYLDESHHNLAGARSVLEKLEPTSRGWEWQHLSNRTNAALQEFEGVTTVEWFPSGDRFLAASVDGPLTVYDARTGAATQQIETDLGRVDDIAISRSGGLAAVVGGDRIARLYNLATGELLKEFRGQGTNITRVMIAPDDSRIVTAVTIGREDQRWVVWNVESGETEAEINREGHATYITDFDASGNYLIGNSTPNTDADSSRTPKGWLWDINAGKFAFEKPGVLIGYDVDLGHAYVREHDSLNVFERESGTQVSTWTGERGLVYATAFSPDGKRIALSDSMGMIDIRDVERGTLASRVWAGGPVRTIRFSEKGDTLVAIPKSGSVVSIWDANAGIERDRLMGLGDYVFDVALSPDGETMISTSNDRVARVWSARYGGVARIVASSSFERHVNTISFSKSQIYVGSGTGWNLQLDSETGALLRVLQGRSFGSSARSAVADGGAKFVFLADNSAFAVQDMVSQKLTGLFGDHAAPVTALLALPGTSMVVSGSWDGQLYWWDTASQNAVYDVRIDGQEISALCVAGDSSTVFAGTTTGSAYRWNPREEGALVPLVTLDTEITALAVAPDGRALLLGTENGRISVFDLLSRRLKEDFSAHSGEVADLIFHPNGQRFFSVSPRDRCNVWAWPNIDLLIGLSNKKRRGIVDLHYDEASADLFTLASRGDLIRWLGSPPTTIESGDRVTSAPANMIEVQSLVASQDLTDAFERYVDGGYESIVVGEVNPLLWLGLVKGDVIEAVNEDAISNAEELRTALVEILASEDAVETRITLSRNNVRYEYHWELFDRKAATLDVTVSLEALRESFQRHSRAIDRLDRLNFGANDRFYRAMGIEESTKELPFGIILDFGSGDDRALLERIGLAPNDRLMAFDGAPVASLDEIVRVQDKILLEIGQGARKGFTITVIRGSFRELEITCDVVPG